MYVVSSAFQSKSDRLARQAEINANRIGGTTLTMGVKVGDGGKLYGSITAKDIADALARRGITVDRHKIDLEEPLKSLGTPADTSTRTPRH